MAEFIFTLLPVFAVCMAVLCLVVFSLQNKGCDNKGSENYGLMTLISFVISCIISLYLTLSPWTNADLASRYGQMGDYFGGMLNPILAFASFIALLYTIRIQSEELRYTREELAKTAKSQQELVKGQNDSIAMQTALSEYDSVLRLLQPTLSEMNSHFFKSCNTTHGDRSIAKAYQLVMTTDRIGPSGGDIDWIDAKRQFKSMIDSDHELHFSTLLICEMALLAMRQYHRLSSLASNPPMTKWNHNSSLFTHAELVAKYLLVFSLYEPNIPFGHRSVTCMFLELEIERICMRFKLSKPADLDFSGVRPS